MQTIYKYPFEITDEQIVNLPEGFKARLVDFQNDVGPCIWAEVDTNARSQAVRLRIYGTGHPIDETNLTHIGSFQNVVYGNSLVWHVYIAK